MAANLSNVPSNSGPSGQNPVSYPLAIPAQQTEVQSKVHNASDALPNPAEAATEAILGKVSDLSEKANQIGKCYTTAVKIMDFLATYGVNLLLATGAIAGGILGAVLLNVPAGVVAITLGVAELVHIYRMQPAGNPKVDALLNKFKEDINGIQGLNEANKKVTAEIGKHIQNTHTQLESLLQGLEEIEALETHNDEGLNNLKTDILTLITLAELDKAEAFRLFDDCKNKSQEAEKGFESCEKLIEELALLDTTTLSNEESVNKLTTNIAKLNGDFGKSFTLYRKSQKKLTKGLIAFTAAASKNEEIKGKIELLKSDSENILNLLQAEKEKIKAVQKEVEKVEQLVEVVEEQQEQIDHLTEELGNTSEKVENALKQGTPNSVIGGAFGAWIGPKFGIGAPLGAAFGVVTPYLYQNVSSLATQAATQATQAATQVIVKAAETIISLEGSSSSTQEEEYVTSDEANSDKPVSSSASRGEEIDEPVSSLTEDEPYVGEIVGDGYSVEKSEGNDVPGVVTQEKQPLTLTRKEKFLLASALTNKLFIERAKERGLNLIAKHKEASSKRKEQEAASQGPNFM